MCNILGDTSRVVPGESTSVLAEEPLHQLLQWFFSSCSRKLGVPLELRRGPQGTSCVASGNSGLLSSCEGHLGIHFKGHLGIHFKALQGNRASSGVEAGNSIFLSSCDRDLGVPIKFQQGSQGLSHFETWNSAFLSGCKRVLRHPVEIKRGTRAFSRGAAGD